MSEDGHILWTADAAATATGGQARRPWQAQGVSIDTRSLEPGDLFVALTGDNRDGHAFVAQALESGAAAAMVSEAVPGLAADAPLLHVPDTLAGLEALGRAARSRTGAQIAAVTGSVGKTSTKDALAAVLSQQGLTHASMASYNNHWGVPLTLARMPSPTRFGIYEVGMNHAGEIRPLTRMVRPHVALVTTVAPVHLEHFAHVDDIAEAKAEIFEGLETGTAVVPADNTYRELLTRRARESGARQVITFGEAEDADYRLARWSGDDRGSDVEANLPGGAMRLRVGPPGRHWAVNAMAILAVVDALGADLAAAASALAGLRPPPGRGKRHVVPLGVGSIVVIDESYNANPTSMKAALALLAGTTPGLGGRRIALLGDMLELGPAAPDLHRDLAEAVEVGGIDLVGLSGPLMGHLWDALPASRRFVYGDASEALIDGVPDKIRPGDVIMIKGSLGSRMRPVVEALLALAEPDDTDMDPGAAAADDWDEWDDPAAADTSDKPEA